MRPPLPLLAAGLPLGATVTLHQIVPSLPVPEQVNLIGIGPIEHVGRAVTLGITGLPGLAAMGLLLLTVAITLREAVGRLRPIDRLAFGLFAGGALSNGLEAFLRGTVIDWLWLTPDGRHLVVINAADMAIATGTLLMIGRVAQRAARHAAVDLRETSSG